VCRITYEMRLSQNSSTLALFGSIRECQQGGVRYRQGGQAVPAGGLTRERAASLGGKTTVSVAVAPRVLQFRERGGRAASLGGLR
jgi:hypothetical protein